MDQNFYNGNIVTDPLTGNSWNTATGRDTTEDASCDCGYMGRHTKLRHWLRLRYMKERW